MERVFGRKGCTFEDLPAIINSIKSIQSLKKPNTLIHLAIGMFMIKKGGNNIADPGCLLIVAADLSQLIYLNLGYNNIQSKGCQYLARGKWKQL